MLLEFDSGSLPPTIARIRPTAAVESTPQLGAQADSNDDCGRRVQRIACVLCRDLVTRVGQEQDGLPRAPLRRRSPGPGQR